MTVQELAERVFTDFVKAGGGRMGTSQNYDRGTAEELGVTWEELKEALVLLADVGLFTPGIDTFSATALGRSAARSPDLARAAIWEIDDKPTVPATHFDLSGSTFQGPTQTGTHNVQHNITTILQQVANEIARDPVMTVEQKAEATGMVKKIMEAAQGLGAHVVKAGAGTAVVEGVKLLIGV